MGPNCLVVLADIMVRNKRTRSQCTTVSTTQLLISLYSVRHAPAVCAESLGPEIGTGYYGSTVVSAHYDSSLGQGYVVHCCSPYWWVVRPSVCLRWPNGKTDVMVTSIILLTLTVLKNPTLPPFMLQLGMSRSCKYKCNAKRVLLSLFCFRP